MKKSLSLLLAILLAFSLIYTDAYADTSWPENVSIEANSGIVMDANSTAVLYGKNIHDKYYPVSITKILSALIILEHCKLDEQITFSHNAVYNVESGSSSAGYDEGDTLSVNDALHAMLLKSANEVANALAEHCSGSIEEFSKLMNEKAKELGATESHFSNPSGLNDTQHYTTAYDFALIARAAFSNPTLTEIAGKRYYNLPPSKKNPEGLTVYAHHAMLRKTGSNYYEYAKAGKTGYTSEAGNTLVTYANNGSMGLITVILGSKQTHYSDTRALMDFGFNNFKTISLTESSLDYEKLIDDIQLVGSSGKLRGLIYMSSNDYISLPKSASVDEISTNLSYELDAVAPKNALALITYSLDEHTVGSSYLLSDKLSDSAVKIKLDKTATPDTPKKETWNFKAFVTNIYFIVTLIVVLVSVITFIAILFILKRRKKAKKLKFIKASMASIKDTRNRRKKGFRKD